MVGGYSCQTLSPLLDLVADTIHLSLAVDPIYSALLLRRNIAALPFFLCEQNIVSLSEIMSPTQSTHSTVVFTPFCWLFFGAAHILRALRCQSPFGLLAISSQDVEASGHLWYRSDASLTLRGQTVLDPLSLVCS